jgi:hypothetical protein
MAYPEPIAPNSIAPRPALNQQQGDHWAAIAAASAHLPEVKDAMRIIDEALSKPAPSLAPAPATNPPTASDKHLLHALHHGTLVEPHHHKRSASATARGRDPTNQTHNLPTTATPMDTRAPHHRGGGWPPHGAILQTNQPPTHQLTRPAPTPPTEYSEPPLGII